MELFVRTAVRARADDCRWSELGARLEKRVKCAQVGAARNPQVLCAGVTSTWPRREPDVAWLPRGVGRVFERPDLVPP